MKGKSMMRVIPLFMSLNMLLSACAGASLNSQINVLTGSAVFLVDGRGDDRGADEFV